MENPASIEYLAGLFDGEGTVTLTKRHKQDIYKTPVLQMTSTTYKLLEICKATFGGYICTRKVRKLHHKPSWSWNVPGDKAIKAMSMLLPFIQEPDKARRMKLVLEKYKSITPRNGYYTPNLRQAKQIFETEFFHPSSALPSRV